MRMESRSLFTAQYFSTEVTLLLPSVLFQSAVGFEYAGKTEKHASQKGKSSLSDRFRVHLTLF